MLHHPEITMELQLDNTRQVDQVEHVTKYTHKVTVVEWLLHSVSLSQEL
jgi:hypothetical protein